MDEEMKEFGPVESNESSRVLVQNFVDECVPAFDDYCGIDATRGPVFMWSLDEVPDLAEPGIHLVDGDLIIPQESLSDREDQFVLIAGDLSCRTLHTGGWIFVDGHLRTEVVEASSGCNNLLYARSAKIGAILEKGHSVVIDEALDCGLVYSEHGLVASHGEKERYPISDAANIFLPELLVEGNEVDWAELFERIATNRPWKWGGE